ncbi:MAG: hypothetical protein ABIP74_04990 [Candidatus Saccharimonas sp.]
MEEPTGPRIESTDDTSRGTISSMQPSSVEASKFSKTSGESSESLPRKKRSKKAILITMAITFILLVSCATYGILQLMRNKIDNNPTANMKNTTQVQTANPDTVRDSAITQSLNDIETGMAASSNDQTSADTAISDSDQQITVPTE